MRFILDDTEERIFSPQRWCFRGSIDDWISVGNSDKIDYLAKKLIPKLGTDDFYEFYRGERTCHHTAIGFMTLIMAARRSQLLYRRMSSSASTKWPRSTTKGAIPALTNETREEALERLQNTPTHLCRLRYFGNDEWGFAFYTNSHEKYEVSVYPNGEFTGKPEDAFLTSAVYLDN